MADLRKALPIEPKPVPSEGQSPVEEIIGPPPPEAFQELRSLGKEHDRPGLEGTVYPEEVYRPQSESTTS